MDKLTPPDIFYPPLLTKETLNLIHFLCCVIEIKGIYPYLHGSWLFRNLFVPKKSDLENLDVNLYILHIIKSSTSMKYLCTTLKLSDSLTKIFCAVERIFHSIFFNLIQNAPLIEVVISVNIQNRSKYFKTWCTLMWEFV